MQQPGFFFSFLSLTVLLLSAADGQAAVERIQVMFTPTVCKVRCSQDRCINFCERSNLTTLYNDGAGGRRDGAPAPGFRVCETLD
ncbi:hypothetical protein NQZ68_028515 [Dissostichus eleginoides]|nr:hypothetical protein NQZ68_028515 [Dissostichus eleginoides]